MTYDPSGNIFKQLLEAVGASGGGTSGNTAETLAFYAANDARLQALEVAIAAVETAIEAAQTISAPADAPLFTRLSNGSTAVDLPALLGALNETAPATDTAAAGFNGRLQRIAQRITSLIGLLPGSLGQKASAASLAVVLPSDQSAVPVIPAATLAVTAETLNAIGLSASVAMAGKTNIQAQLLWTGASTDQVVRLSGSFDGGTTWHLLGSALAGETYTLATIADFATAGLQPGIAWLTALPNLTHVRLRWISGTATNLAIKWSAA